MLFKLKTFPILQGAIMSLISPVKRALVAGAPKLVFNADACAQANIGSVGDGARALLSGYRENDVAPMTVVISTLVKPSLFAPVFMELGKAGEMYLWLTHVLTMAGEQSEGGLGDIIVDGNPNLFCLFKDSKPWVLTLRFFGNKKSPSWHLGAYRVDDRQKLPMNSANSMSLGGAGQNLLTGATLASVNVAAVAGVTTITPAGANTSTTGTQQTAGTLNDQGQITPEAATTGPAEDGTTPIVTETLTTDTTTNPAQANLLAGAMNVLSFGTGKTWLSWLVLLLIIIAIGYVINRYLKKKDSEAKTN